MSNQSFLENLHVLLVSYFNLGMTLLKIAQTRLNLAEHAPHANEEDSPLLEAQQIF